MQALQPVVIRQIDCCLRHSQSLPQWGLQNIELIVSENQPRICRPQLYNSTNKALEVQTDS